MTQKKLKTNHQPFLDLVQRFKQRGNKYFPTEKDFEIIINHAEWLESWIDSKRRAALANPNPGRKRKPPSEIKPESLRRRNRRDQTS